MSIKNNVYVFAVACLGFLFLADKERIKLMLGSLLAAGFVLFVVFLHRLLDRSGE